MWLHAVKYFFVTVIEGCIDVAHHLVASERWASPDTNAAAFRSLGGLGELVRQVDGWLAAPERAAQS